MTNITYYSSTTRIFGSHCKIKINSKIKTVGQVNFEYIFPINVLYNIQLALFIPLITVKKCVYSLYNFMNNIYYKSPCFQSSVLQRTSLRVIEFNLTVITNY